ncbi:unnamed protein product, partial [Phaeothamnion confervicola]
GLSKAQAVLLRQSWQEGAVAAKAARMTRRRRDGLAQHREKGPDMVWRTVESECYVRECISALPEKEARLLTYGPFVEGKNCTHRPRTRGRRRGGGGGGDPGSGTDEEKKVGAVEDKDAFFYTMDAKRREHETAMELRRGQQAYAAMLDKKVCPKCGAVQSYDEVGCRRSRC